MSKAPSISSTAPSIANSSPSPKEPSAARAVIARHIPFINYEPITKKGIVQSNPRLICIFTNKEGIEPPFEPFAKKEKGSALGTIYKVQRTEKKWLGKVGFPTGRLRYIDFTRPQFKDIHLSVILEKIAYDFYQELGRGLFILPKTVLSKQKVKDPFNEEHELAITWTEMGILETLRIMSKYVSGYKDFSDARTPEGSFMDYIKKHHRPPEMLLTESGEPVPLLGFIEMVAVGRVLADTDLLGKEGGNAGFKWIEDNHGKICAAQAVKIDPGEAFHFKDDDPEVINLVHRTHEKRGNDKYWLSDLRDVQTANNHMGSDGNHTGIEWKALTEIQKEQFLTTLLNCLRYKNNQGVLRFLIDRDGKFCREITQEFYTPTAERITKEMTEWLVWQEKIYAEDLQAFAIRHPEEMLRIQYIDRYGELPLPTSEEMFPIRDLFTQLALLEYTKEAKQDDPKGKETEPAKKSFHEESPAYKEVRHRVNLDELFSFSAGDTKKPPPRKVLIVGNAGSGKTTLCQKIAHDWASGRLWKGKYKAVYWLRSREYNTAMQEKGRLADEKNLERWLAKVIALQVLGQDSLLDSLHQQMRLHKREILIVCDGCDEASPELAQVIDQLLADPEINIVLSSRHEASEILRTRVDRIVQNAGFSDDQMVAYSQRFFLRTGQRAGQQKNHAAFLTALRAHPGFLNIAHIPLHLQMLCSLWEKGMRTFPSTLTALYEEMVHLLFSWHYQKAKKDLHEEKRVLACLGELALWGLNHNKPIPVTVVHASSKSLDDLLSSGLLRESGQGDAKEYHFTHLTFQEYLAAQCVSLQSTEARNRWVVEKRYLPRFQTLLSFLAGIISKECSKASFERSKGYFTLLHRSEGADLVGYHQFDLTIRCLNECPDLDVHAWVHATFKHKEMLPQIISTLSHVFPDSETRRVTQFFQQYPWGLQEIWKELSQYLEEAVSVYGFEAQNAIHALTHIGEYAPMQFFDSLANTLAGALNPGVVSKLTKEIKTFVTLNYRCSPDSDSTAKALGKIGKVATGQTRSLILKTLLGSLNNTSARACIQVIDAIGEIEIESMEESAPVVPVLLEKLKHPDTEISQSAAATLGKLVKVLPHEAPTIVTALLENLRVSPSRSTAATLGKLVKVVPPEAPTIVTALLENLEVSTSSDLYDPRKGGLFETLRGMPELIPNVIEALIKMLKAQKAGASYIHGVFTELIELASPQQNFNLAKLLLEEITNYSYLSSFDDPQRIVHDAERILGILIKQSPEQIPFILTDLLNKIAKSGLLWGNHTYCPLIFKAVKKAPEQIPSTVSALLGMQGKRSDNTAALSVLIEIAALLTAQQAAVVVETALRQVSRSSSDTQWIKLLNRLAENIPVSQIPYLVRELLPPKMHNFSKSVTLFGTLASLLPKDQLSEIVKVLLDALTTANDRYERPSIIKALGKLGKFAPQEQLRDILAALQKMAEGEDLGERASLAVAPQEQLDKSDGLDLTACEDKGFDERTSLALALDEIMEARLSSQQVSVIVNTLFVLFERNQRVLLDRRPLFRSWEYKVRGSVILALAKGAKIAPADQVPVIIQKILQAASHQNEALSLVAEVIPLDHIPILFKNIGAVLLEETSKKEEDLLHKSIGSLIPKSIERATEPQKLDLKQRALEALKHPAAGMRRFAIAILIEIAKTPYSRKDSDIVRGLKRAFKDLNPTLQLFAAEEFLKKIEIFSLEQTSALLATVLTVCPNLDKYSLNYYLDKFSLNKYLSCLTSREWRLVGSFLLKQIITRKSLLYIQKNNDRFLLCTLENNQIISQPISAEQAQFFELWSNNEASAHKYTASYRYNYFFNEQK